MAAKAEQVGHDLQCRGWRDRHEYKRRTARLRRRLAKRLLEDAPQKRAAYSGWAS